MIKLINKTINKNKIININIKELSSLKMLKINKILVELKSLSI
jgi:hypothetical protein